MQLNEIMQVLNKEIEWCNENPDTAFHAEYRKGFINGLIQAKYLISEVSNMSNEKKDYAKKHLAGHLAEAKEAKCPECGGVNIEPLTLHNATPLSEQFMYACRDCGEWFNVTEEPPPPAS